MKFRYIAINAKKIEEWVVPRVVESSRKKIPTIGLIYGGSHCGLEQNLKSSRRRERVIELMKKFIGYNAELFNQVIEATHNVSRNQMELRKHTTNIFFN